MTIDYAPPALLAPLLTNDRSMPAPRKVGVYARISKDELGRKLAIERQIPASVAYCEQRGWTVGKTYSEVTSASKKTRRAQFEQMMSDARSGVIDAIVVWDADRLTRQPRENEDVIDLYDRFGIQLGTVGGDFDLATAQGRLMFRLKGIVAAYEVDQLKRRLRSKFDERASHGLPHAPEAFGYKRCHVVNENGWATTHDELDEEQAQIIRDCAKMLLDGRSLRAVTAELNERGIASPRGKRWESSTLRQILLRERNAGRRIHREEVIGEGRWPSIYENDDTHDRVVALLTDPTRRTSYGSTRVHLMTGLLICGRCGSDRTVVNMRRNGGNSQPAAYCCRDCNGIRRKQSDVDDTVNETMIEWLKDPEALSSLAAGDPHEIEQAEAEIKACKAKLDLATDAFAASDDIDDVDVLTRLRAHLQPRIRAARAIIAANLPHAVPSDLAGPDAAANWAAAALDTKRAVIELGWTITLLPQRGRTFDPSTISFVRKERGV